MQRRRLLLLLGLLLVALNFRPAVTSIPPVLEAIRTDLNLSYTAVSLLTTIPTLCMGLFAFAAVPFSRRLGRERAILWMVALIGVATAMRVASASVAVLFGTTILIGVGIAVSQTLLPSIVNEHFSNRAALVTGLYTTSLGIGAALAAGGTALISTIVDSWPAALAVWSVFGVAAIVVWAPIARATETRSPEDLPTRTGLPWRSRGAWILTVFFAVQSILYYSELTWIAPVYVDLGWGPREAGFLLTLFILAGMCGTLGISALADRTTDRRPWLILAVVLNTAGLVGIVWFPLVSPWGWAILTGGGMGGMFALDLTLPADLAPTPDISDRLTAMMVGVGYAVGAVGPFGVGGLRDFLGSYDLSFIILVLLSASLFLMVVWFRPDRRING